MFQFTRKDPKTGITYVYEQESRWVPELKQSRAIRRVIGKLDENGNIVPTRPRAKKNSSDQTNESSAPNTDVIKRLDELEKRIVALEKKNSELQHSQVVMTQRIKKAGNLLTEL